MPKCPQCGGNTRSAVGALCCRCERNNFLMKKYGNLGPRKKNRDKSNNLNSEYKEPINKQEVSDDRSLAGWSDIILRNRGETVPLDATKTVENVPTESKSKVWEGLDKKVSMTNRKTAEMKEKVEPVCDGTKKISKPEDCVHYKQHCPMIKDDCYPAHIQCIPHNWCSKNGHTYTR